MNHAAALYYALSDDRGREPLDRSRSRNGGRSGQPRARRRTARSHERE